MYVLIHWRSMSHFHRQVSSGNVLSDLSYVVNSHYSGFSATGAFIATWLAVPAYDSTTVCRCVTSMT